MKHRKKAKFKYDETYKRLFSHPVTVKDLLTEYVAEEWIADLDFSQLERVNSSYITEDLRRRESDVIWRLPFRGKGDFYIYLLLEFQSSVNRYMALRLLTYICLLYQDLLKQDRLLPSGNLPPVLPIVLYNGERRWKAPTEISELIEPIPGRYFPYIPSMKYCLLDEGAIVSNTGFSPQIRNAVTGLFQLEFADNNEVFNQVAKLLLECLQAPEYKALHSDVAAFFKQILMSAEWTDEASKKVWEQVNGLEEVQTMLAERINQWPKEWIQKGFKQGIEQGIEKGIEQGIEKGIEQGIEKGIIRTAKNMMRHTDLPDEQIAAITGLALNKVRELRCDNSD